MPIIQGETTLADPLKKQQVLEMNSNSTKTRNEPKGPAETEKLNMTHQSQKEASTSKITASIVASKRQSTFISP